MDQQVLQSSRNGYSYQVLIVDDDPVHRALEREVLDSPKYAVSEASDFIRKPYQPSELLARLDAAVSHKRLTDQLDSADELMALRRGGALDWDHRPYP